MSPTVQLAVQRGLSFIEACSAVLREGRDQDRFAGGDEELDATVDVPNGSLPSSFGDSLAGRLARKYGFFSIEAIGERVKEYYADERAARAKVR